MCARCNHILFPPLSGSPGGRRNGLPSIPARRPKSERMGYVLYSCRGAGRASMGRRSCRWLCMGYRPEGVLVGKGEYFFGHLCESVVAMMVITPVRASQSKVHHRIKQHRVGANQTMRSVVPTRSIVRVRLRAAPMLAEVEREPVSGILWIGCPVDHKLSASSLQPSANRLIAICFCRSPLLTADR